MRYYHCPTCDCSCPYYVYEDQGTFDRCTIENPPEDCDNFYDCDPEDFLDDDDEEEE